MNEPPHDTLPLAALSPDERTRALERYRMLQPCVEHNVPLTRVAHHHNVPLRTAQWWLAQYRRHGFAGMARRERRDRKQPHGLPPELTHMIEGLALRTPPPTVALVHRQVCDVARRNGWPVPNYKRVYRVIKHLDPALVTLAHDGSNTYRTPYDLLYRREAEAERQRRLFTDFDWYADPPPAGLKKLESRWVPLSIAYFHECQQIADPTTLVIIDEADRLKMSALEQVGAIFDQGGIGVVFIGMPGLEKRLSRYPQLYSRVGFVHAFRALSAAHVRKLLQQKWVPSGVELPEEGVADEEALAAIIRVTGGNFRLLHRLLTQIARLVEINALQTVTREVMEAARESLVIGAA